MTVLEPSLYVTAVAQVKHTYLNEKGYMVTETKEEIEEIEVDVEPSKPKVPSFLADLIECQKYGLASLTNAVDSRYVVLHPLMLAYTSFICTEVMG